jgi:hypothetical protein
MSDLVQRLSIGRHPVELSLRPERTINILKECLDRDYVHVKFTGTRGGTELGVPLDRTRSDLTGADFENATGRLLIVGELKLDYIKVRCSAEIQLPDLVGTGWLEPIPEQT